MPATIVRAVLSRYVGANALVRLTDVMLVGIGTRSLVHPGGVETPDVSALAERRMRLAVAATAVGLASWLLANSGGFLLVPVYLAVLHLPIKSAFASSLLVSAALAVTRDHRPRGPRSRGLAGRGGVRPGLGATGQRGRPRRVGHRCGPDRADPRRRAGDLRAVLLLFTH